MFMTAQRLNRNINIKIKPTSFNLETDVLNYLRTPTHTLKDFYGNNIDIT